VTNDTPISLSPSLSLAQQNFSILWRGLLHTPGTTQCVVVVVVCRTPFDGTAVLEPFHPIPTNKNDLEE
jgi:hypothetical protein